MADFDYEGAADLLAQSYSRAEIAFHAKKPIGVSKDVRATFDVLFRSKTQAFREAYVGCILVRLMDKTRDVRRPYVQMGESAYNGRTLDERVVNPLMQNKQIPTTKGPYLSVLRRDFQFTASERKRVKDAEAYDAFLAALDLIEHERDDRKLLRLLDAILLRFIELREDAVVPLNRIDRLSLEQLEQVAVALLEIPSGGRFPVLLVAALVESVSARYGLKWKVNWQEINVADKASGAGGDVEVHDAAGIALTIEVTERPVDVARVTSTFRTKIAPKKLADYLFLFAGKEPSPEVLELAGKYFAMGHEVNFLAVREWFRSILALVGQDGRKVFLQWMLDHLQKPSVPKSLRVAWNEQVQSLAG